MDVDASAAMPDIDEQHTAHRRSSYDGAGPSAGSLDSSEDYSDTGSSGSGEDDDDDISDDETLADRHARSLGKRASADGATDQPAKKRRRSSSDSGSTGSGGGSSRKRRNLFPAIRRSQRCGTCHTCLNPQLKKACQTVRERMMKEMQGSSKSQRGSRAAAGQQQQQLPLSPAGSADLDQDKYADLLIPHIDSVGGLTDASCVTPFINTMPSFRTTAARVLPVTVLSMTKPLLLADFMSSGGVDVLATWMLDAMGEDTDAAKSLLTDILRVLQSLPVTRAFVQSTKSCKVIGALRKHDNVDVRNLARRVVDLWMKVVPSGNSSASSAKPGNRPAGGATGAGPAAAAAAGSSHSTAAKKATGQGPALNGAAAKGPGSQVQMISDNDLFKPAAAKAKTSLRLGMGQQKKSQGVQLVDTAEAGKLLTSGAAAARQPGAAAPAAGGGRPLGPLRGRMSSPPLSAGAAAAAATQPRVAVELQVTPEQTVTVTLRVLQPPAGRLPGLRRTGFGSSLGQRPPGASATPGAVQAAISGAAWGVGPSAGGAEAAADKKPRKPKKRVSWKSERELESVRWFIKDDPAINARQDAHLTEEQMRALAASHHQHAHHDFHDLIMMEHQHERVALETHHREEEERHVALVAAMQPGCPWHGTPPALQLNPEWQVAGGEDSTEAQRNPCPIRDVLHHMQYVQYVQPEEREELRQPPPAKYNMAHHDPAVKLIPLFGAHQQPAAVSQPLQQPVVSGGPDQTLQVLPMQQPAQPQFGGQPFVLQQPQASQPPQQPPPPVTYTLGQGLQSQPRLVMQPLSQPLQAQQVPLQQPQQQAPVPAVSGPPSSSDNSQLMQVLQSLSQSGLLQQQQQQQQQQQPPQQPVGSQIQLQAPPPQQLLQPQPVSLPLPAGGAGQVVTLQNGMQVMLPPGVTALPGQPVQLPAGFVLAPPQQQQPPPQQAAPVVIYSGQPGGHPPPPHGVVPFRPEEQGDYGPPPGPGAPWGGPHGPPPPGMPPRDGLYGRGGGQGEGLGGPQRHGRAGRGGAIP